MNNAIDPVSQTWFAHDSDRKTLTAFGFRHEPGGVHLSKTMMFAELERILEIAGDEDPEAIENSVIIDNALDKSTGTARKLALSQLNTLYGIKKPLQIQTVMLKLWARSTTGHALLALLCSLAREPLLRDTASPVLEASPGNSLRWTDLAAVLAPRHPGRYSPKMLKSLSQNCASTWTQSGHLKGKVAKHRARAEPSAEAAAYAAYLGSLAGFGGPALLASPWMRVLDRRESDLLPLLRRAESAGLIQLRAGGGVVQLDVQRPLAQALGVPNLADG